MKSTIHWVSAPHALDAEVRLYDRLFTVSDPTGQKNHEFTDYLNQNSLEVLSNCKVESAIQKLQAFDRFQFERLGYFCIDPDSTKKKMVINRSVTLRDVWAKIQQQQQNK